LLLALACANLANLFAARATRHERELTVRLALGSSRAALVRRLVIEALLLASVASGVGLALVAVSARMLPRLLADQPGAIVPAPSATLVACAAALAALAALGAGLLPAVAATRGEVAERLRATAGAAFGGRRGARVRRSLVAVQVALSTIILVLAGLLVRSLDELAGRHPGYEVESVLTFKLDPRLTGLSVEAEGALGDRIEKELGTLPGVVAIARGETPLLEGSVWMNSIEVEGYEPAENESPQARFDTISPAYLEALRLPLLRGRVFGSEDRAGALPVALVNQKFVRDYLPDGDPIGRRVRSQEEWLEIVGVVGNALSARLREVEGSFVYRPYAQAHDGSASSFYLRTAGDPTALAATVRQRVAELAPGIPVVEMRTLADQAKRSLRLERLTASVASALGTLAAALAAIGLYGVLAYAVDSRRRELALRAALGAAPRALSAWVVAHAALPVGIGLAAGAAVALAAGGRVGKLLYGVAPRDPATLAGVVAGLLAIATVAAAVPARRALAVEPAAALREE
jgi:predicted permease